MRNWINIINENLDEAVTKSGAKIEFKYEEDIEGDNRGFVLHKLTAYILDHAVGYLKVDYVDDKEFKRLNPEGIYSWMSNFGGHTIPDPGQTLDELTPRQMGYLAHYLDRSEPKFENVEQLREFLKGWEKTPRAKDLFKQYKAFIAYHVNIACGSKIAGKRLSSPW